jgi:hypothetical protein
MPALTGQCKRCLKFGALFPIRGVYYCRACGDLFERHLRGYQGPDRRGGKTAEEDLRRRWSDVSSSLPDLFLPRRSSVI